MLQSQNKLTGLQHNTTYRAKCRAGNVTRSVDMDMESVSKVYREKSANEALQVFAYHHQFMTKHHKLPINGSVFNVHKQ